MDVPVLKNGAPDWPLIDAMRRSVRVLEWGKIVETTIDWSTDADIPCVIAMAPKAKIVT
jgi:hypothetical protein